MSMVPMGGNKPSFNPSRSCARRERGHRSMHTRRPRMAQQWKVSREVQDASALNRTCAPSRLSRPARVHDEITPFEIVERRPASPPASRARKRTVKLLNAARARHHARSAGEIEARCVRRARQRHGAGNSSQTSDGAGALDPASEKVASSVSSRRWRALRERAPPEIMGRIYRGHSPRCAMRACRARTSAGTPINEAFAAQSLAVMNTRAWTRPSTPWRRHRLGHPLGAAGPYAPPRHALRRHNLKYGMVTMWAGPGRGRHLRACRRRGASAGTPLAPSDFAPQHSPWTRRCIPAVPKRRGPIHRPHHARSLNMVGLSGGTTASHAAAGRDAAPRAPGRAACSPRELRRCAGEGLSRGPGHAWHQPLHAALTLSILQAGADGAPVVTTTVVTIRAARDLGRTDYPYLPCPRPRSKAGAAGLPLGMPRRHRCARIGECPRRDDSGLPPA